MKNFNKNESNYQKNNLKSIQMFKGLNGIGITEGNNQWKQNDTDQSKFLESNVSIFIYIKFFKSYL